MPCRTKRKKKKKGKRKSKKGGFHCRQCDPPRACPSKYKTFKTRMAWLRRHRKRMHPTAHKKSVKKSAKTKKKKGNPRTKKKRGNPVVKEYRKYTTLTPEGRKGFAKAVSATGGMG